MWTRKQRRVGRKILVNSALYRTPQGDKAITVYFFYAKFMPSTALCPRQRQYFLCTPGKSNYCLSCFSDAEGPKRIKYRFPTGSDPAPRLILSALQIELLLWPLVAPRLSIATRKIRAQTLGTKTGCTAWLSRRSINERRSESISLLAFRSINSKQLNMRVYALASLEYLSYLW